MSEEQVLEQPVIKTKKLAWNRILRPVVSLGLLFFLLRGTNWSDFLSLVGQANWLLLITGLALVLVAVLVSAYKWQRLLVGQQTEVPLPRLFVFYLVGLFFNNFLPTNIGGDLVRIHDLAKYTGKTSGAAASVVAERLLAAFALALTAALGLLLSFQVSHRFGGLVIGVFVVTIAIILLFAVEKWRSAMGNLIKLPEKFKLREKLTPFAAAMSDCMRDRLNLAWVIALSMGFHFTVVLVTYFIFLALGVHVPFAYCLLFIPIISAIQMLPVSISGFGVREGAYVYFFGSVGLSGTQAIAASLTFWALVAIVSLAGGLIFATRR